MASASFTRVAALVLGDLLHPEAVLDVLGHRHVREQRVVLEHRVHVALVRRQPRHVLRPRAGSCPAVGFSNPAIIRRHVVLPEPDGPSMEKNSPSRTSRSTPSTAATSPKRLTTPSRRTATCAFAAGDAVGQCSRLCRPISIPLETLARIAQHLDRESRSRQGGPRGQPQAAGSAVPARSRGGQPLGRAQRPVRARA